MKLKLRGIHFGSYWMKNNDVVYLMSRELEKLCYLKIIDTKIYYQSKSKWYYEDFSQSKTYPVRWLDENKVMTLVKKVKPHFVICNAGGMSLTKKTVNFLKKQKIITVAISLSDPDVFWENGRIYSHYYDLFYTNSLYALDKLYLRQGNCRLLPFAASPKLHRPMPKVKKIYDIVIVGHAREERLKLVNELKKNYRVGLFGKGWGNSYYEVHGLGHVRAINSGKIYLSFSTTMAGYTNVKVGLFEAAACKVCVVTTFFEEMEKYFKYGVDILGYKDEKMLFELLNTYLKNERLINWIAENGYKRLLTEHTWEKRWLQVLSDIKKLRAERYNL